ncbi:Arc family DNA-binding protein [Pseudomonas kuykendallii]|uniref:Arc family DNA-binding protein n=1 Tax=Pseudomonas kuykendallii TaxID=1007099 RepID=UPI0028D5EC14|nr:Arc family DNA-binding protein [Pseudomonas kuykendallii]
MKDRHVGPPYSLRIPQALRDAAQAEAHKARRSLNTELGILIEEALQWRKQREQAKA